MNEIRFSTEQKSHMAAKVKKYFNDELQQDIGSFDAEFLIDFFAREIGPYYYNRGLQDSQQLLHEKMEEVGYLLQELEQPEGE
ncbi:MULTISPECIES: DUF2164 domain-containing protein [unclassified Oceanobacter]|jgi:uncharacterized protein (DUF2164 family)|uniref:DUF2164 domain-containing protein n=1 Tax=unclassified Oceanobacter TaxID=2620260 RepID=UPI0026E37ABA|nr:MULTISPECIES: DUF2164 domain-containing protein [unclassified Oceanobacter]MDO6682099.1 DUF2164 domain-containing protein [Oceanobacter sp. 5_MG-2023]MDP2505506.1 DUF2164 domain-containing protein [Oceanobacter sp. 3_MG-2023]MDP2547081.1 DUF2164 domain-containing protein [Oceanobacter sp. 4_MG-2023]MDP2609706.1 DUF2164 domain-containing protein [Oceanobacter sp. 1_MG-2023]MDP2613037.1 DUF2164 domain-containing protein [Oceanobacter sp. 2_MG-2023]